MNAAKALSITLTVDDSLVRPIIERGAHAEILLTYSVEWLQRFILALERSTPSRGPDPFQGTIRDLRALVREIQGHVDS